jgi:hypothetical protein
MGGRRQRRFWLAGWGGQWLGVDVDRRRIDRRGSRIVED